MSTAVPPRNAPSPRVPLWNAQQLDIATLQELEAVGKRGPWLIKAQTSETGLALQNFVRSLRVDALVKECIPFIYRLRNNE